MDDKIIGTFTYKEYEYILKQLLCRYDIIDFKESYKKRGIN